MEFTSLARRVEIGANAYLVRAAGKSLVLDSGLHPKERGLAATPQFGLVEPGSIDAIAVTHAHQDHIGSLPILTRREQQARVFMTPATQRIGEIMLRNSVNVMTRQREDDGITEYPLFTQRGVGFSKQMWFPATVRQRFGADGMRGGNDDGMTLEFYAAGHILGSVGVAVRAEGKTLFYTGDVNFDDQTLMRPAAFPDDGVDILVMETTRGDSPQIAGFTRAAEEERFIAAIERAFSRGGSVTIPVFALGKTQEVLAMLWKARRAGRLKNVPLYIGGLSTKVTTAYDALADNGDRYHPDLLLLHEMAPYVLSGREVESMPPRKGCIFAISSGMMSENTLSNIFVRKVLPDADQTLFFVGYSDPDSPAGKVRAAKRGDTVSLAEDLPPVEIRCEIENFNFSAHASRESLADYAVRLAPAKVLLVHGDVPAVEWFRSELGRRMPEAEILAPPPGETLAL